MAVSGLRASRHEILTAREREVHALLHLRNKQIAARLGIGIGTVKCYVSSLMRKLQARTRTAAALMRV